MPGRRIVENSDLYVRLPGGGTVELRLRIDWSKLDDSDKQFVTDLIRGMFAMGGEALP